MTPLNQAAKCRVAVIEKAVAAADEAAAIGECNSEIWLSRKRTKLARLHELVAPIDDATITPGAVLRLDDAARYAIECDGAGPTKPLSGPSPAPDPCFPPSVGVPAV